MLDYSLTWNGQRWTACYQRVRVHVCQEIWWFLNWYLAVRYDIFLNYSTLLPLCKWTIYNLAIHFSDINHTCSHDDHCEGGSFCSEETGTCSVESEICFIKQKACIYYQTLLQGSAMTIFFQWASCFVTMATSIVIAMFAMAGVALRATISPWPWLSVLCHVASVTCATRWRMFWMHFTFGLF